MIRRLGIGRSWSLTTKTALLAIIYLIVPALLYSEFSSAYNESQQLLLRGVSDEGQAISQSLLPWLETVDNATLPELGRQLARFAGQVATIKLLLRPADTISGRDGFYYVASWPAVAQRDLRTEHDTLAQQGVLQRLATNCRGELPFPPMYERKTGSIEIITAVIPLSTPLGCWAVVVSFSEKAFPSAHLGQPYWATPLVRIAALSYLAMAVITFSTLLSVRRGLRRFAERAYRIRALGPEGRSFSVRDGLAELDDVAAEFDLMVEGLHRSAAAIRSTAEENAHAFKTPIAVIRQSIEPLRRVIRESDPRAHRAIGLVEHSLDRLDGLVVAARRLDEATADLLAEPRVPVDLGRIVGGLVQIQSAVLAGRGVSIILASHELMMSADLVPGLFVLGTEEMIESIAENLIENAVSFAPPGSEILVHLTHDDSSAHLTVSDQGPGLPVDELERIFDRYAEQHAEPSNGVGENHVGIELWTARRNAEAMGGAIEAESRTPHGLAVHVRLPLAQGGD